MRVRAGATDTGTGTDRIPSNKDCMLTWFQGGATTVKKVGVHNEGNRIAT